MSFTNLMQRADRQELRRLRAPKTLDRLAGDLGVRLTDVGGAVAEVPAVVPAIEDLPIEDWLVEMCDSNGKA